tara:strand:+ start:513 stop:686 length:174 start_codon:yes stop_codon:yes gene_type:complete
MEEFTIQQLAICVATILSAVGGLCLIIHKSKCSRLKCCGIDIKREVKEGKEEEIDKV